ncbi:hypothetical protein D3C86_1855250 [compost metagenome]
MVDTADERGFTRTGRAAKNDFFALANRHVDVFKRVEGSIPLSYPFKGDQRSLSGGLRHGTFLHAWQQF